MNPGFGSSSQGEARARRRARDRSAASFVGTVVFALIAALPVNALPSLSISMTTAPLLVLDSNSPCVQGPDAAYVGFRITNTTGSTISNLQATLTGFASGFSLAGGQAGTQYVGSLAAGASRSVFWFFQYPCTFGQSNTFTATVFDGLGFSETGTGTVTTNSSISANAGGQVSSATLGPGAVLGQVITYDVTYSFGNVSNGDFFSLQPAGNPTFDASCFQLISTSITASAVNAISVGSPDALYFVASANQGGSGNTVTVRYNFKYLCSGVQTTASPVASQTSGGTNVKYTGNYGSTNVTYPTASNPFAIQKSASPTSLGPAGGTATYTVTVQNTSGFAAYLDKVTDVLPAGVTYGGLTGASFVTAANSSAVPSAGATGSIAWFAKPTVSYLVPANGSITVVYTATVPASNATYQNSASAVSGGTTVGPAVAVVTTPVALQAFDAD